MLGSKIKSDVWTWHKLPTLAYVDKLAKDNSGVKYVLSRQDLFVRTVYAKGMKTKKSKETVRAFLSMITKNTSRRIWVDKGTEIAGEFKNLCRAEGIQVYSTMSETKATFAEQTIRSLKKILYRYMEDNDYKKYMQKLTQFVLTLNSRRYFSIDLIPKNVKNSDFFSILYSKRYESLGHPSLKLEIQFASRSTIYPSGRVISHSVQKRFSKLLQFLPKNHQHTQ